MVSKKPLALLATASTLAVLAAPALADTAQGTVGVSYTTLDTTRQFAATEVDGSPLADFAFGPSLNKPFRTTVKGVNRLLNSQGYQVTASMGNLYLQTAAARGSTPAVHDFSTYIPSSRLGLSFASPLTSAAHLPVSPKVLLQGALGTCADAEVAGALGFETLSALAAALANVTDTTLAPVRALCTQLLAAAPVNQVVTASAQVVDLAAATATDLANLPFALTGALQGGSFDSPSYVGVGAGDPNKAGTPTSKLIMKGTSLLATGANLTGLLASLTAGLQAALPVGLPLVSTTGAGAKLTLAQAEAAVSSAQPLLANAISALTTSQAVDLLNKLSSTVQAVTALDLSRVTDTSDALPVLTAAPIASKAGTYDGTLVVNFIETN